ncbi:MAG: hypothetical protein QOH88_535 [Verrucomicrobiota bacterium]
MGVTVQQDIDIFRRAIRWNVDEPKTDAVPFQIDDQRPLVIAIAIPAHNRHRRADLFKRLEKTRIAHIAEMPDLVASFRQRFEISGEMIMRVGQDKNAQRYRHSLSSHP